MVVVLAVLGTVLALTLGDDDGGDKRADTKADTSQGASSGSGKGGKDDSGKGGASGNGGEGEKNDDGSRTDGSGKGSGDTDEDGTADGSTSGDSDSSSNGSSDSSGSSSGGSGKVTTYKGAQGFSIGLPKGWKYTKTDSAGARFTGPEGQRLLIAWTSTPKNDPVADWKSQERYMTRSQYHRIRIEKVDYRGWNAADWEFTYSDNGTQYRTIDRGFVVNDHQGYALMYSAKSARWKSDLRKDTWKTLNTTFEPKS